MKENRFASAQAVKFAALIGILMMVWILFRFTPLSEFLTRQKILDFLELIRGHWWGPLLYILIYSIGCVLALPGSLLTFVGGAAFGVFWGSIYVLIASNLGASLAFFAARYLGRSFVNGLIKNTKLASFDEKIGESGFKTIFRLRLIPVVPFNGLNFGAGFSSVKYRDYLLASLLGMLPAIVIYTYFADSLLQGVTGAGKQALFQVMIAGILLILLSFLPALYKRVRG